jgi:hypothetical protein
VYTTLIGPEIVPQFKITVSEMTLKQSVGFYYVIQSYGLYRSTQVTFNLCAGSCLNIQNGEMEVCKERTYALLFQQDSIDVRKSELEKAGVYGLNELNEKLIAQLLVSLTTRVDLNRIYDKVITKLIFKSGVKSVYDTDFSDWDAKRLIT